MIQICLCLNGPHTPSVLVWPGYSDVILHCEHHPSDKRNGPQPLHGVIVLPHHACHNASLCLTSPHLESITVGPLHHHTVACLPERSSMAMASSQQLIPPPTEINDAHKVYSIAAWCIVLGLVTSLCVLWRLGLRFQTSTFGADDYAMVPALVSGRWLVAKDISLRPATASVHWMDCDGWICESACWSRQASLGDHAGGVCRLVQGMLRSMPQSSKTRRFGAK